MTSIDMSWSALRAICDKVHKHVCGHTALSDMQTQLQQNGLLTDTASKYLDSVVSRCGSCQCTAQPQLTRKVSLASVHRQFNEVVCINHFSLDGFYALHKMDAHTIYSAGHICQTIELKETVEGFEAAWLTPFLHPDAVHADQAIRKGCFRAYEVNGTHRSAPEVL